MLAYYQPMLNWVGFAAPDCATFSSCSGNDEDLNRVVGTVIPWVATMRSKRTTKFAKRYALALFLGLVTQSATGTAWGQLVDAPINDASEVVRAQATVPQDTAVPQDTTVPLTPNTLGQPAPLSGAPATPVVPPAISEPFANPLANQAPNAFTPPAAPNRSIGAAGRGFSASLGVTADSFSSAPTMMGDFFGSGVSMIGAPKTVETSFFSQGTILSGSGGSALLAFDFGSGTPNDIFTASGTGIDVSGDSQVDQFDLLEPIPPTDAPTSPGQGFLFAGGQAVYTNSITGTAPVNGNFTNGQFWFVKYSYASQGLGVGNQGVVIAGPDAATRRVKLSENFSPEVRDRFFFNYNFFNDAFGGLGDVSRYVLGFERVLIDDLMSVELRLPMAGTLSSTQDLNQPGGRDFELGNATVVSKFVLLRSNNYILTSGVGATIPLADDAKLLRGTDELLRIENESVHVLPFLGLLRRFDRRTSFQAYTQLDFDANGNPVLENLAGGPLERIGRFTDSSLAHVDVSAHRTVYENRRSTSKLKAVVANAELHYTGTLQGTDAVTGNGIVVTNLKKNFNVLNATMGAHLLVGKNVVITPGMSVPLRDGLDEQFDYEALLQVNYLR